jgi:hypothetical protein
MLLFIFFPPQRLELLLKNSIVTSLFAINRLFSWFVGASAHDKFRKKIRKPTLPHSKQVSQLGGELASISKTVRILNLAGELKRKPFKASGHGKQALLAGKREQAEE